MTTHPLRRRLALITASLATASLLAASAPALLAPAQAGARPPLPPHASVPPDRVALVHRELATASAVPQRTAAV